AGRLQLELTAALGCDLAETVDGVAQRVDDTAEVAVSDSDREHLAGATHLLAGLDPGEVSEDDRADLVLVEVQGQALRAAVEREELVRHHTGESLDVRDAVCSIHDGADL